jgi:hypothetical protein
MDFNPDAPARVKEGATVMPTRLGRDRTLLWLVVSQLAEERFHGREVGLCNQKIDVPHRAVVGHGIILFSDGDTLEENY